MRGDELLGALWPARGAGMGNSVSCSACMHACAQTLCGVGILQCSRKVLHLSSLLPLASSQ